MILQRLQELQSGRVLFEYALRRPLQLSLAQCTGMQALSWTLPGSRDNGPQKNKTKKHKPKPKIHLKKKNNKKRN